MIRTQWLRRMPDDVVPAALACDMPEDEREGQPAPPRQQRACLVVPPIAVYFTRQLLLHALKAYG
jgi:hypothetical protein